MRVEPKAQPGTYMGQTPNVKIGVVYCIESFYEGPQFNAVMLVGMGGWRYGDSGLPIGWRATYFRKVDEIKLCIAAVNHSQKEIEQPNEC